MAAIQWKDANSAPQFVGSLLCRNSRSQEIEHLAQQSVRSQQVEDDLYWVVLNLPQQTSCTLYLGTNEGDAALIEATARGAIAHALEYAFSTQHADSERAGDTFGAPGKLSVGLLGRTQ